MVLKLGFLTATSNAGKNLAFDGVSSVLVYVSSMVAVAAAFEPSPLIVIVGADTYPSP